MSVGNLGYSWASTISDATAISLGFYMAWLNPCNAYSRAYGFQLRCKGGKTKSTK
ncbi:hypothetical protein [uncultured Rikenella sp.]|nr:hypothetical protein [uncultured Rikenella sp.]